MYSESPSHCKALKNKENHIEYILDVLFLVFISVVISKVCFVNSLGRCMTCNFIPTYLHVLSTLVGIYLIEIKLSICKEPSL